MRGTVAVVWFVLLAGVAAGQEESTDTLVEALRDGSASVALRYRFEHVTDEAFDTDAQASTLRTALAYETGAYRGFRVFLEAENVSAVGPADLTLLPNARGIPRSDRPLVADPELTHMNQAGLRYTWSETTVHAGRQEILLDDHRFVGNVLWRQNHQSFDAIRVESSDLPRTTATYAFISEVHGVLGDAIPFSGHVANAAVAVHPSACVVGYAYALDHDVDPTRSTRTFGAQVSGQRQRGAGRLLYELEYADQRAAGLNPLPVAASYLHVMGGGGVDAITVTAGWERLGGSPTRGQFNTPLATLHPFNGWADRFLVTPAAGLEDAYVTVRGTSGPVQWNVTYHDFRADTGGARYGDELDAEIRFLAPWRQTIALKAAFYDADAHSTDVAKLMLWSSIRF